MSSALSALVAAVAALAAAPSPPSAVTFFVASDTHFGAPGMSEVNRVLINDMNALPGTAYPEEIGGRVESPRGVLITGDLTDNGTLEEFAEFESLYGLTGRDGRLRYPVFESIGNHDVNATSPIKDRQKERHGGINYSWDWEDVHFACLDMYPDAATLAWLREDLRKVHGDHPVVLFFHYPLQGRDYDFWGQKEKWAFADVIDGSNVVAIFHGHQHRDSHYEWGRYRVFRSGAPRHAYHTFLVVRVEGDRMTVAARDFDARRWLWSTVVPIRRRSDS